MRSLRPVLVCAFFFMAFFYAKPSYAQDYWSFYKQVQYFDDSGNQVGEMFQTCGGKQLSWGVTTAKKQSYRDFCTPIYQTVPSKVPGDFSITFHWQCYADTTYSYYIDPDLLLFPIVIYAVEQSMWNEGCDVVYDPPKGGCLSPTVGTYNPGGPGIPCP